MGEDPKVKVKAWLAKQGYPLEMRCAKVFQDCGFTVTLGEYYDDPLTQKKRELDVLGTIRLPGEDSKFEIVLHLLVQCKFSEKPWVLFFPNRSHPTPLDSICKHDDPAFNLLLSLFWMKGIPLVGFFKGWQRTAYGGKTALQEKDLAYEAFTSATSAIHGWKPPLEGLLSLPRSKIIRLVFPMVVVEGLTYSAALDGDDIKLSQVELSRLLFKGGASNGGTVMDVVTFSALKRYLRKVRAELRLLIEECNSNPELYEGSILDVFGKKVPAEVGGSD